MSAVGTIVRFGTGRGSHSKFGNTKVLRYGMNWDSKKEADRYGQLLLLQANGELRNIRPKVKYELRVNGLLVATYTADFVYEELRKGVWFEIVEDVKGYPNDRWPMKKKLMKAIHGISVRVT
jgi:hypothetical protein